MRLRTVFAACLVSVSIGAFAGCSNNTAETAPAVTPANKEEVVVAAPGLLEPVTEELKIGSELGGRIRAVLVEEGDRVRQGQIVVTLEDDEYQARIRTAEAAVKQRESELQRLLAGARREERQIARYQAEEAQAILNNSRIELRRREELFKTGDISKEDLERAQRDYNVAAARSDQASQNQALVNAEARSDDIAKAQAAIDVAKSQLAESRTLLAKTIIRCPINAIVLRKHLKTGENVFVDSNTPILTIGDTAGMRVRVDVDEADIGKIQVGQKAYVSVQAYGDKKFWGRVVRISQILGKKNIRTEEPTERIDKKILETLIELDEASKLPPGLRVNAFIIVAG